MSDLVDVYNDAAGRPVTSNVAVELGGRTLGPGVYSSGGVFGLTGTLTLNAKGDPNAVFIFQSASTLTTASGSVVRLINGARFCRVFWVVPSSATLGTGSTFVGHIFAVTSIAAQSGATVQGQLLAQNGEVTLDTNTITNGICADVSPSPSPSPTLTPSPTTTPTTGPIVPGLPTTGYPPEGHGPPWLLLAGSFAACITLLFAAWRSHATSRRHG